LRSASKNFVAAVVFVVVVAAAVIETPKKLRRTPKGGKVIE